MKQNHKTALIKIGLAFAVATALFGSVIVHAQSTSGQAAKGGKAEGKGKGPPREMIAACANKASGASCTATGPQGRTITGTCMAPEGRPLACRPTNGGQGGTEKKGPPPTNGGTTSTTPKSS
jgi:hypothetical protein